MLLRGAVGPDGQRIDIRITGALISEAAPTLAAVPGEVVEDLAGFVLLPAPAEPHAHLDKALTADEVPNPAGDLMGAITAWQAHRPGLTRVDIARRARRALLLMLANGTTAVRTHVDVGTDIELLGIEALSDVRRDLGALLDLQIVALVGTPLTGVAGADHRALLRDALDAGADVAGGCPHLDPDPHGATEIVVNLATERGVPIDLHTDETLEPTHFALPHLAVMLAATGHAHGTVASHCVSLGMQPPDRQREVAEQLAAAGVAVVTLPQTNLFLMARDHHVAPPRGLTALRPLLDAGVVLAGGADNLQDPFNSMGRADALETAALLVMAGHLLPQEAYDAVSSGSRAALGLPAISLTAGSPAELMAVPAASRREAMAMAPGGRLTIHRGVVVARGGSVARP